LKNGYKKEGKTSKPGSMLNNGAKITENRIKRKELVKKVILLLESIKLVL
jgi:hypothetical protein